MQSSHPKDQPPTNAKVVMFTSHGQIEIQLWGRQTPLTTRNFLQHSLDGYYNNTIFHRMIPGFMIQGGDPLGTGTGGQSIYGKPFQDQPHQRLKFTRRGLLAMANCGKDTNTSQFFLTFGQCEHLNKKHTIFGRVIGDTIFNLMSLQSIDTDKDDRPTDPPTIRRIKVILNPFDDMESRKKQQKKKQVQIKETVVKKIDVKKLKNKNKLTFDTTQFQGQIAIKSSHEILKNQKFSNESVNLQQLTAKLANKNQQQNLKRNLKDKINISNVQNQESLLAEQQLRKKRKLLQKNQIKTQHQVLNYTTTINPITNRVQMVWQDKKEKAQKEQQQKKRKLQEAKQKLKLQSQGILADELNFKKIKEGSHKHKRKMMLGQQIQLLSNAQRMRYEFVKKKQQQKTDVNLFDKLNSFTSKLNKDNKGFLGHQLKFHIDSEAAYKLDQKKRNLHLDQGDLQDGGLKIQIDYNQDDQKQFNVDQLYDMIHGDDN